MEIKKQSIAILTILILLASALGVIASINITLANNEPTYDVAVVDGDFSEWDTTADFFSDMVTGSGTSYGTKLYLRADCQCGYVVLYILVLDSTYPDDSPLLAEGCDSVWVKIDSDKVLCSTDGDDGTPPDFAWINLFGPGDMYAQGWEGSIILANGDYTLEVHTNTEDSITETQEYDGPLTIACTPEDCCDDPPVCDVITWVVAGGTSTPTAFGTWPASWIDSTAGGVLLGMSCDGRPAFDIDPAVVDQSDGTPQVGSIVVTSGGPAVNGLEKYYEVNKISPVYYFREGSGATLQMVWKDSGTDSPYEATRTFYSSIGETYDVFIIQQFMDGETPVIMVYGIEGRGTLAGAHYYYANAGFFEDKLGWWVYEWIDDPVNGSIGHPDYGDADEFNLLDSGGV